MSTLNERGLTLVEILVAAVIIGIGLVGLMSVVPISSYGVYEGNSLTRATFLAEQKMEEIKNGVWRQTPANDCVGLSAGNGNVPPTSNACTRTNPTVCASGGACTIAADENPVANNAGYTRTVRIVDCSTVAGGCGGVADANFRRVTVTVTYPPLSGTGAAAAGATKPVVLTMNIARR
jgi:prepilin-type N-terminal cleavage/methylation domain-containing protein